MCIGAAKEAVGGGEWLGNSAPVGADAPGAARVVSVATCHRR